MYVCRFSGHIFDFANLLCKLVVCRDALVRIIELPVLGDAYRALDSYFRVLRRLICNDYISKFHIKNLYVIRTFRQKSLLFSNIRVMFFFT